MLSLRGLAMLAGVGLLAACTASGPVRESEAVESARAIAIDEAVSQYRIGTEQAARGDTVAGHASVERATSRLRELADDCLRRPGCDASGVVAAYDGLISRPGLETGVEPESDAADASSASVVDGRTQSPNLLNGRALREVIELGEPVKAALTEWLTWMRPQLLTAWDNYQYMRHQMWPEYERAEFPEALLFGILAKESGGRVHAVSRAGATGPMQFMYPTGLRYGLGRTDGFDTRYDPAQAARASVAYLQDRLGELGGDLELALAAYNGGEGRMARLHRAHPGKRFWDPEIYSQLPAETREYVPMVLAAAWLFLHPEEYGLEFGPVDPRPGSVLLVRPATLNELAICIGSSGAREGWFRVLRNLNPRLRTNDVVPAGSEFALPRQLEPVYYSQCVEDGRASLARALVSARAPVEAAAVGAEAAASHTVRRGETLAAISRRHGCGSVAALARANGIEGPAYMIRVGQRLRLDGCRR